jgi:hypothetical protein
MKEKLSIILRWITALILIQMLFFKFSGIAESIYVFTAMNMEPWGRIGTGMAELVIAIFLIFRKTVWLGAVGGLAVISGALHAHFKVIGLEVMGDNGLLFGLAVIVFVCCTLILWIYRKDARKAFKSIQKAG